MDSIAGFLFAEEEENNLINIRNLRYERAVLRISHNALDLPDRAFIKNFRLNKTAYIYVLNILEQHMPPAQKAHGLKVQTKLNMFLRFIAEGGYQHGIGQQYDIAMAQSTVSATISEVLVILERILCPIWIRLEMTEEERQTAKSNFYRRSGFPGVVMCVDGTHIKLITPSVDSHLYYNRKGFYSINALIICDDQMIIRCVDPRFPGSCHDAHVWNMCDARSYFEEQYRLGDKNTRIIGDSAYELKPWFMTPFRAAGGNLGKTKYNKHHIRARNIMERTIGLLKNRFRYLLGARQLHYCPVKVAQITNVCSALHNICIHYKVIDDDIDSTTVLVSSEAELDSSDDLNASTEAITIRNRIMNSLR